jgi:hypothetical protein
MASAQFEARIAGSGLLKPKGITSSVSEYPTVGT